MMETNIPKSVQEIIDFYIRFNFRPFEYETIAKELDLKVDTLIQRISRNKEYFEIDSSQRPSKITLKQGKKEIYFYRDKNTCLQCRKVVSPNHLMLKFRNPSKDNKHEWNNVVTVCTDCKEKEVAKKLKKVQKEKGIIEYKEIHIYQTSRKLKDSKGYEYYYIFDELDGTGTYPLLDEDDNIISTNIASILNYFGTDGWDLVHLEEKFDSEYDDVGWYQIIFKRKRDVDN